MLPVVYWEAEIVILSSDLLLVAMGSSLTNFLAYESSDDFWSSSENQDHKLVRAKCIFHAVELGTYLEEGGFFRTIICGSRWGSHIVMLKQGDWSSWIG